MFVRLQSTKLKPRMLSVALNSQQLEISCNSCIQCRCFFHADAICLMEQMVVVHIVVILMR